MAAHPHNYAQVAIFKYKSLLAPLYACQLAIKEHIVIWINKIKALLMESKADIQIIIRGCAGVAI